MSLPNAIPLPLGLVLTFLFLMYFGTVGAGQNSHSLHTLGIQLVSHHVGLLRGTEANCLTLS